MKTASRRILRIVLGSLSLLVGVAGIFLPILQGWLFLGIGALLLSPEVPPLRRLVKYVERRYPKIGRRIRWWREKFAE